MEICLQIDNIVYEKLVSTLMHPLFFLSFSTRTAGKKIRLYHEIRKGGLQSLL